MSQGFCFCHTLRKEKWGGFHGKGISFWSSEIGIFRDADGFPVGGMGKFDGLCVQVERLVLLSVKFIPYDGAMQAHGVRGVYAELVCASRVRIKGYARAPVCPSDNLIIGNGCFPVLRVRFLNWACRCWCAFLFLAMISRPEVAMSRR